MLAPTASAVMGDLVMAARNRVQGGRGPRESKYAELPIAPIGFIPTRYYVSMNVADRAGVAVLPLTVGRESSIQLIQSLGELKTIVVVAQRDEVQPGHAGLTQMILFRLDQATSPACALRFRE